MAVTGQPGVEHAAETILAAELGLAVSEEVKSQMLMAHLSTHPVHLIKARARYRCGQLTNSRDFTAFRQVGGARRSGFRNSATPRITRS
jgi:hypothetical protein